MQFTIRTLLYVTLIVALFCSAAVSFSGLSRYYAIIGLTWIVYGGIYLRFRLLRSALIPHVLGPIVALMIWLLTMFDKDLLWIECLEMLPQFILIGLFVGIIVGSLCALLLQVRRAIKIRMKAE
jgi:hypothetical protein